MLTNMHRLREVAPPEPPGLPHGALTQKIRHQKRIERIQECNVTGSWTCAQTAAFRERQR